MVRSRRCLVHPLHGAPHIKNNLLGDLAVSHLKDVNQTHFNLLASGKVRPVTIAHHLKGHDTVVHDAIFSRESLEELKLHVPHSGPKLPIILAHSLLSREGPIESI